MFGNRPEVGHTLFNRFELLSLLGEGGMGAVYKVKDKESGETLALKLLINADKQLEERFQREFEVTNSLSHPNIIKAFEFFRDDQDRLGMTLECVNGKTLDTLIYGERNSFSLEEKYEVLLKIAQALSYAHEQGVVHRDLKPENIMIPNEGQLKIIDFGIGKRVTEDTNVTKLGQAIGTVYYMSPEQIHNQDVDHRTDIYAFGVLVFELVTGQRPFEADSSVMLKAKQLLQEVPPVRETQSSTPAWLELLIETCLNKSQERRYESFTPILHRLEWALGRRRLSFLDSMFTALLERFS